MPIKEDYKDGYVSAVNDVISAAKTLKLYLDNHPTSMDAGTLRDMTAQVERAAIKLDEARRNFVPLS